MNKKMFFLAQKELNIENLNQKVKIRIDKYLGFSNEEILKNNDAIIFGGAIRDSIANQKINDIDIATLPNSCSKITNILLDNGFEFLDKFSDSVIKLYENTFISQPYTFYKEKTFIQLIRPRRPAYTINDLTHFASQVDLSCCALAFFSDRVFELKQDAIFDCLNMSFSADKQALLYNEERCIKRIEKLKDRGWAFKGFK